MSPRRRAVSAAQARSAAAVFDLSHHGKLHVTGADAATFLHNLCTNDIKNLAVRHNKYGAKAEHYAVVGECLIWTLKAGLAERWTKQMEEAWLAVYTVLANAMVENQRVASENTVTAL
jgi:hemoglobin-like flavoprotein